jgi:hypothetical protein
MRNTRRAAVHAVRLVIFALALVEFLCSSASAGSDDYLFEPVQPELRTSMAAQIAVRLVRKVTREPIIDAKIVQLRFSMPAEPGHPNRMTSTIVPLPHSDPGVYAFKVPLTMEGLWLLSIAVNVQGEPEPVVGEIGFRVTR